MSGSDRWSDLTTRLGSGVVMLALGMGAVWAGGTVFKVFVAAICAVMIWELVQMLSPLQQRLARGLAGFCGLVLLAAIYLPAGLLLPLLFVPSIVGVGQISRHRTIFLTFNLLVMLAGFGMISIRDDLGFVWLLWLALVVVGTDIAGYFAGRFLGGPKFWPRVSPKKTWSGTVAGWLCAAAIGAAFASATQVGAELIGISVAAAMASQMGDIGESAIKRRMRVKDSSNLIPGHGGLLDRFDGMLGAAVFILLVGPIIGFPPGLA